jgi:hypothetical protein
VLVNVVAVVDPVVVDPVVVDPVVVEPVVVGTVVVATVVVVVAADVSETSARRANKITNEVFILALFSATLRS